MFFWSYYLTRRIAEEQRSDRLREAETYRLLRQAGVDGRGWLSCRACWLLSRLGHLLVVLGQRLERYGPPQTRPLRGRQASGVLTADAG